MKYEVDNQGDIVRADVNNPDGTVERLTFDFNRDCLTETHRLGLPR